MAEGHGYYVFTPLSGDQIVCIHRADCRYAHRRPEHPDRDRSWHWFPTYTEALEYARRTGRRYRNKLDCQICAPS